MPGLHTEGEAAQTGIASAFTITLQTAHGVRLSFNPDCINRVFNPLNKVLYTHKHARAVKTQTYG